MIDNEQTMVTSLSSILYIMSIEVLCHELNYLVTFTNDFTPKSVALCFYTRKTID